MMVTQKFQMFLWPLYANNMNQLLELERSQIQNSHWPFFGCFMQQNPQAVLSLNRLLNAHNFSTIIELGTHDGGLSTLFALYCFGSKYPAESPDPNEPSLYKNRTHHKSPKSFYTFDLFLRDVPRIRMLIELGATFHRLDFLKDAYSIEYIGGVIRSPGTTLLLCDGGNKKKEFEIYAPFLKEGDVIMAHDWAFDEEAFNKNKKEGIWVGWESRWENGSGADQQFGIKDVCVKNGIVQVYEEEFDKCVWFCGVKTERSDNKL